MCSRHSPCRFQRVLGSRRSMASGHGRSMGRRPVSSSPSQDGNCTRRCRDSEVPGGSDPCRCRLRACALAETLAGSELDWRPAARGLRRCEHGSQRCRAGRGNPPYRRLRPQRDDRPCMAMGPSVLHLGLRLDSIALVVTPKISVSLVSASPCGHIWQPFPNSRSTHRKRPMRASASGRYGGGFGGYIARRVEC